MPHKNLLERKKYIRSWRKKNKKHLKIYLRNWRAKNKIKK